MQNSLTRSCTWITQIKDFSGLRFGSITPTDIDAFIAYKDIAFIFIERKHEGCKTLLDQKKFSLDFLDKRMALICASAPKLRFFSP